MASSSGNSFGSNPNSGSEGGGSDLQLLMDQRKRKRMESNRKSARRSRMRKQKHVDDLMAQADQLNRENNQILTSLNTTTQHFLNVEAENSVLRAQMMELSQRLESLNGIINYMNNFSNNVNGGLFDQSHHQTAQMEIPQVNHESSMMNSSWDLMYLNQQPIMASAADIFQY